MASSHDTGAPAHDSELSALLERVVDLSAAREGLGPDAFLAELAAVQTDFQSLRRARPELDLSAHFESFARRRFALVDESSEYAQAADEVLVLSMVVSDAPESSVRAVQESVLALSGVLLEPGVLPRFAQLLKRARQIARQTDDAELKAWVAWVAHILPSDAPSS